MPRPTAFALPAAFREVLASYFPRHKSNTRSAAPKTGVFVKLRKSSSTPLRRRAETNSPHYLRQYAALHVGQSEIATGIAERQPLVIAAELFKDGRVPV